MVDPESRCSKCKRSLLNPNPKTPNSNTIVKCHGDECKNKFHLSCLTNIPPNSKVYHYALNHNEMTENHNSGYICDVCDIEGSSRYLMEYFEDFLHRKQLYYMNYTNTCVMNNTSIQLSFISFLFQQTEHRYKINSMKGSEINCDFIRDVYVRCGQSRDKYSGANHGNNVEERARRRSTLSTLSSASEEINSYDYTTNLKESFKEAADNNENTKNDSTFTDPSILIGKPIRLYSPIDNKYHIGRIIDSRTKTTNSNVRLSTTTPSSTNHTIIPNDFLSIEYLVRFREGLDSRKVAVHQWITLEEHAISIGLHLIWADVTPANACKQSIIPGQIMLRSALEMIPIKRSLLQENKLTDQFYVFCLFFNNMDYSIINLNGQCIPFDFQSIHKGRTRAIIEAFWNKNRRNDEKRDENDNNTLDIAIGMAGMEYEEERRMRSAHKLSMVGYDVDDAMKAHTVTQFLERGKVDENVETQQQYLPNSITLKRNSRGNR